MPSVADWPSVWRVSQRTPCQYASGRASLGCVAGRHTTADAIKLAYTLLSYGHHQSPIPADDGDAVDPSPTSAIRASTLLTASVSPAAMIPALLVGAATPIATGDSANKLSIESGGREIDCSCNH